MVGVVACHGPGLRASFGERRVSLPITCIIYNTCTPIKGNKWKIDGRKRMGRPSSGHVWIRKEVSQNVPLALAMDSNATDQNDTKNSVVSWSELRELVGRDWRLLASCLAANVLSVVAYVLVAPCLGNVIDVICDPKSSLITLGKAVAALGSAYIVSNAALASQVSLAIAAGERLASRVRSRLFHALLNEDTAFYSETSTGTMISWLGNDVDVLQTSVAKLLGARGVRAALETIGIIGILTYLNWLLALTLLISAPVLTPLVLSASGKIRGASQKEQLARSQASSIANELIENQKIVKVYQSEDSFMGKYFGFIDTQSMLSRSLIGLQALLDVSGRLRNVFCVLVTVGLAAHLALLNQVSVGTCYSFFIYSFGFSLALSNVTQSLGEISRVGGTMKHVMQILRACEANQTTIRDDNYINSDMLSDELFKGCIEFRDVCFTHPDGWSMKHVSFKMAPHTTTALVGPSGGGKSTIACLLLGIYVPDSGEILVDGVSLRRINKRWWLQKIGVVEQRPGLLTGKVRDIVTYGREGTDDSKIWDILQVAQAADFVRDLPGGLESEIGGDGIQLSGGMNQRIAMARALIRDPAILILDEATSALDVNTESAVTDALQRLREGGEENSTIANHNPTTMVIAHRFNTIRNADNIVVIENGRVVEMGSHDVLMSLPNGVYSRLYSTTSDPISETHAMSKDEVNITL